MGDGTIAELAYLAGVVDSDGYVTATVSLYKGRKSFGAKIGITGSSREPHDLASSIFGGNVTTYRPGGARSHHRAQFLWSIGGSRSVHVIRALLPYLRIKAERACLAIALQEEIDLLRAYREAGDPAPWMPPDWDPAASLQVAVDEIRELNTPKRDVTRRAELLEAAHV